MVAVVYSSITTTHWQSKNQRSVTGNQWGDALSIFGTKLLLFMIEVLFPLLLSLFVKRLVGDICQITKIVFHINYFHNCTHL